MASNEHRNLQDPNIHNPKGFQGANNETVLCKGAGSSYESSDGSLHWSARSTMGVTNYKMQGYSTTAITNYAYGEDINDTKSPFEMVVDYGATTVSAGSLSPSNYFRIGQSCVVSELSKVTSISGWITSNNTNVVTIAICKITPITGSTGSVVPIVIHEIATTGLGNNNDLARINETTITTDSLAAGDIIFPMIKEETGGSTLYMNLSIQTTTY
tara:strand:+ start:87 stop:728 length:642 start_codon:yes stop_codon:yes gene_type:complete